MSKPIQRINRYKIDLRELSFLLFEQFGVDAYLGKAPFGAWGPDEIRSTVSECYRGGRGVVGPINSGGDHQGCKPGGAKGTTPEGYTAGWNGRHAAARNSIC